MQKRKISEYSKLQTTACRKWLARKASDGEVARITPLQTVTLLIVLLGKLLYADFEAWRLLASSFKLKSDSYNKVDKGNAVIFKSRDG